MLIRVIKNLTKKVLIETKVTFFAFGQDNQIYKEHFEVTAKLDFCVQTIFPPSTLWSMKNEWNIFHDINN